ncbi:MAG: LTA synthase family protein [Thermoanaerobaculaceae bacterium]
MLVRDGDRTRLPAEIPPGASVRLQLLLRTPDQPGQYLLQLAMVREQVCWYPTPKHGAILVPVRVWSLPPLLTGSTFLLTLGLVLGARRLHYWQFLLVQLPVLWLLGLFWLLGWLFALMEKAEGQQSLHFMLLSGACALVWPLLLFPGRYRAWLAAVAGLLATLITFADALHTRFFGSIVPLSAWRGAGQVGQVWESVRSLTRPGDLWLALVAVACLLMLAWPRVKGWALAARERWINFLLLLVLWSGSYPVMAKIWSFARAPQGSQVFSLHQWVGNFGLWGAHLLDALRTGLELARSRLSPEEEAKVRAFFSQRAAALPPSTSHFGALKGANLILIQVESLQNFVVNLSVSGQEVTPFLNRLAKEALCFSWIFDQTNQGRSSDAEFMALNSQHALGEGAVAFRAASNRFLALPKILQGEGYHTLSAHPFERGFWNRAVLHPRYGFQQSFFKEELGPGEIIGWGLADGAFFRKMLPILQQTPQPFFAFLITLGLHHPFDAFPAGRKTLTLPDLGDSALANYLQAMRYFDQSLEGFFRGLAESGLLSNTVVALYGDHESGFPLQAPLANLLGIGFSPGRLIWLRRVPFFVVTPRADLVGDVSELGGHVDIAPTLLYLLGVARPWVFVGSVLLPGRNASVALGDGSAVNTQVFWNELWQACEDRFSFSPLPPAACAGVRAAAQEELWASRTLVLYNLIPKLAP